MLPLSLPVAVNKKDPYKPNPDVLKVTMLVFWAPEELATEMPYMNSCSSAGCRSGIELPPSNSYLLRIPHCASLKSRS